MVNNPMLYATIIILRFVAQPGFQIISSVSWILTLCPLFCQQLLFFSTYFWFFLSHYNSSVGSVNPDYTCEITISLCTLEDTDTRAYGIMDYFPQLLKYQDFWGISSILKELYYISDAPWDVLKIELWFIIGDLDFPREKWFSFC